MGFFIFYPQVNEVGKVDYMDTAVNEHRARSFGTIPEWEYTE